MTDVFKDTKAFADKFNLLPARTDPHIISNIQVRLDHLQEELDETISAVENNDLEEVIDGLIDLIYIAAGTLEMCNIKSKLHWNEVQRANMSKERGVTKRGHAFDVKKPEGWVGPDHTKILNNEY